VATKKPSPHSRKKRYQLYKEIEKLNGKQIFAFKESKEQGTLQEQLARKKKEIKELLNELEEEFKKRTPEKDECSVFVVGNSIKLKPPYTGGKIIWKSEKVPSPTINVRMLKGTYEECLAFMEEKCKK